MSPSLRWVPARARITGGFRERIRLRTGFVAIFNFDFDREIIGLIILMDFLNCYLSLVLRTFFSEIFAKSA